MGWLFMNRSAMGEHNTPKRYLDNQFTFPPDTDRGRKYGMRVIKSAHTSAGYFAAVQNYNDAEQRPAFAMVCLVKWRPSAAIENFGYKDMSEFEGPYHYECPLPVLKALGDTDNAIAIAWRQRARQWAEKRARPKPKVGDIIKFAAPVKMTDGYKGDTFMVGRGYGSLTFKPTDDIGIYTIRNVMDREWSLVAA
jgi:hypothetical protein